MTAFVFPGQGAQFEGMGLDLFENNSKARDIFHHADEILGFELSKTMFYGSSDELKQTKVTQPALFVHSIATLRAASDIKPDAVAGHSLGEFSALVSNGVLSFDDGLRLVYARAMAMQRACELTPGTMAAILGLDNNVVEEICASIDEVVVAANYNCPGQLVISGSVAGVHAGMAKLTGAGAKRAIQLEVGGAFHSPLMEPAKKDLEQAILNTKFNRPACPVYQNINAFPETDPEMIQKNLIDQLTGPVRWTQIVENMLANGINSFVEVGGSGKVLSGLIKKVDRTVETRTL
ncbi:MAG: ACP S-malonyltransferase [Saprospiraceae bacterium]|jgi:[acyl-carrier-protein] S-malonyltransferase|nr:ACP S-malonyltransferase [Saprospiraceae bacterium]